MRIIETDVLEECIKNLLIDANYTLSQDLVNRITDSQIKETDALAKKILHKLTENLDAAKQINVPICQDTGMAVIFMDIGQDVHLVGKPLQEAVNLAVADAYTDGYMRKSVVRDPLFDRTNTGDNTPAILYTHIVPGDKVKITVAPKGFGSENMSATKMFTPAATKQDIVRFVAETVKNAGGNPCPPVVVGVGLGGDFEYAAYLSKLALTRNTDMPNANPHYAALEQEMLEAVNQTGVGPQGFGGKTTALAVNVEYYPTHIAGLPCAVNIGCHVTRHKTAVL